MRFLWELVIYCALFWLVVKCAVRDSGRNCLYFYPKEYIDLAAQRGIAERDAVMAFMVPFCIGMLVVLILMVSVGNHVTDFKTAYLQSYLLLVGMNWFDGIVMDRLWVGRSKIWAIPGMEGVPYIKPWKTVLLKRSAATVLYLLIALVPAGLAVLLGKVLY